MRPEVAGLLFLALIVLPAAASAAEPLQVLEGRIVRSLAVHPEDSNRILVGNKRREAGGAEVYESRDGGRTWTTLNQGRPLDPAASDVQALAYGPDGLVLAGTWKHGLFVSRDAGGRFEKDARFPESDVRDLLIDGGGKPRILAATGRRGVIGSGDAGRTWRVLGPDKTFVWSLAKSSPSGAALYAASPTSGVHGSIDHGASWYSVFEDEGVYALSALDFDGDSLVLAAETGLYASPGGKLWLKSPYLDQVKLSSVLWESSRSFLVGSWDGGVYVVGPEGQIVEHLLPKVPVVHLRRAGRSLLIGTWGQGLFVYRNRYDKP